MKDQSNIVYYADRHTKFIKMRHVVVLEDEIIRGSKVHQEVSLDEKQVCAPYPTILEHFFVVLIILAAAIIATSIVGASDASIYASKAPIMML